MKTYLVSMAYETGFKIYVKAVDEEHAEKLAMEIVNDFDIPDDADIIYRDFYVTDSE